MNISAVNNIIEMESYKTTEQSIPRELTVAGTQSTHSEIGTGVAQDSEQNRNDNVSIEEVKKMTTAMNRFAHAMDIKIEFDIHEKTHQMMVQVIDRESNKVIKEIPSREFLDTVAGIREYVGILLDKKA